MLLVGEEKLILFDLVYISGIKLPVNMTENLLCCFQPQGSLSLYKALVGDSCHDGIYREYGVIFDVNCMTPNVSCLTACENQRFSVNDD